MAKLDFKQRLDDNPLFGGSMLKIDQQELQSKITKLEKY